MIPFIVNLVHTTPNTNCLHKNNNDYPTIIIITRIVRQFQCHEIRSEPSYAGLYRQVFILSRRVGEVTYKLL